MKRALISVSDKQGIIELAKAFNDHNVEIISTGGTYKKLKEAGIEVKEVTEVTGFPECFDGRVKTLHPKIHGGILARRDIDSEDAKKLGIDFIDYVIVNLYPFKETINKEDCTLDMAIENIDIGGPTMLRSAAKNFKDVCVVVDPSDYSFIIDSLDKGVSFEDRLKLSAKVFRHTALYDSMISNYLSEDTFNDYLTLSFEKVSDLRYGENPHQKAAFYSNSVKKTGLAACKQIHGKELSFNNINDASAALDILNEFKEPCIVAVKHTNPCGVGIGETIYKAFNNAYDCDPQSIFGGIIASNREIDKETAKKINEIFIEIVIAPSFSDEALTILQSKKNIRLMIDENIKEEHRLDIKKVRGGILVQEYNDKIVDDVTVVTENAPTEKEMESLLFAMKVCKHIKSNGIVFADSEKTLSIGPGQTSRIWAMENAIRNTFLDLNGSVMASDAFFPFDDCVELAHKVGVKAIIQPGGSKNDQQSIDKANEYGIKMVFTGIRHFKH